MSHDRLFASLSAALPEVTSSADQHGYLYLTYVCTKLVT